MEADLPSQLSPAQTDATDELLLDLEAVLGTKGGRHVLMWVLEQSGLYASLYAAEPGLTELNVGRRDVGIRLLAKMEEVSPTAYPTLLLNRARDKFKPRNSVHVLDEDDDAQQSGY